MVPARDGARTVYGQRRRTTYAGRYGGFRASWCQDRALKPSACERRLCLLRARIPYSASRRAWFSRAGRLSVLCESCRPRAANQFATAPSRAICLSRRRLHGKAEIDPAVLCRSTGNAAWRRLPCLPSCITSRITAICRSCVVPSLGTEWVASAPPRSCHAHRRDLPARAAATNFR